MKYYIRFRALEAEGILVLSSNVDLFCLHSVFLPAIQYTMDRFYTSLRVQRKSRSTKNPGANYIIPSCAVPSTLQHAPLYTPIKSSYEPAIKPPREPFTLFLPH